MVCWGRLPWHQKSKSVSVTPEALCPNVRIGSFISVGGGICGQCLEWCLNANMESLRHHVGSEVPNLVKSDSACSGSTEKEALHLVRIVLGILLYLAQVSYQLYLVFTYITNASIFVTELKKVRQIIMVLELLVVVVVVVVVVYMCSW